MWGKLAVIVVLAIAFLQAGYGVAKAAGKPVASVEVKSARGLKVLYSYRHTDKRSGGTSHDRRMIDVCSWVAVSSKHKLWKDWSKPPEQVNLQCSFDLKPGTSFNSLDRVRLLVSWKLEKDLSYKRVGVFVKAPGGRFSEGGRRGHCSDDKKVVFHKLMIPFHANEQLKFDFVVKAPTKCKASTASWPPVIVLADTRLHFKGFAGYIE